MKYDVNVIAACEDSVWDSDTGNFPATVKNLISGLNVDYKFKMKVKVSGFIASGFAKQ